MENPNKFALITKVLFQKRSTIYGPIGAFFISTVTLKVNLWQLPLLEGGAMVLSRVMQGFDSNLE